MIPRLLSTLKLAPLSLRSPLGPGARTVALCLIAALSTVTYRIADFDLFARVAVGRLITTLGAVPKIDPFAYTPTKPVWIDHEWLSGLIFYRVSQLGGDLGLLILTVAFAALTLALLVQAQEAHGSKEHSNNQHSNKEHSNKDHSNALPSLRAVFSFLALFPSLFLWNSVIRAQVFTFLFFALLLLVLARRKAALLLLSPIVVIWANTHGGFVVGLGYLGLALVARVLTGDRSWRQLLLVLTLAAGGVLLNPYGVDYLHYIAEAITMPRPAITEWAATGLERKHAIFYLIGLLAALLPLSSRARRSVPLEGWLFLAISLFFGVRHQRHTPFFLFTAAVYLPSALSALIPTLSSFLQRRLRTLTEVIQGLLRAAIVLCPLALATVLLRPQTTPLRLDTAHFPVTTLAWISEHTVGGKLLVHFNSASFALWKGYPQLRVAIDGRYEEVYPNSTFLAATEALHPDSPHFEASFRAVRPDYLLLCEETTPLELIGRFPGPWREAFRDNAEKCAVFVENQALLRTPAPAAPLPSRDELLTNLWKPSF